MKKITIFFGLCTIALLSCTKTDLNTPTKGAAIAPGSSLVTAAQKSLVDAMTNSNVFNNVFRLMAQYWAQTTYPTESQYRLQERKVPDTFWDPMYHSVLKNLEEAKTLIPREPNPDQVQVKNQLLIIDMLQVYTYSILVSTFGDIPYSQALNNTNMLPAYDKQDVIFADLLKKLDTDISGLNPAGSSFDNNDIIYKGSVAAWIKFGNSLKLRLGLQLADADPVKAKTTVESAVADNGGLILTATDNARLKYLVSPPNNNPVWADVVQGGRTDWVPANTIVDIMNNLQDPRRKAFFTMKDAGYLGGIYGSANTYGTYSHINPAITAADFEALLFDNSETEFLLAEAKERGFNVPGTAIAHYNNAVKASLFYWGCTDAEYNTYISRNDVAYDKAPGDYKRKIGTQQYLAFYNRGVEGWLAWRRYDYPIFNVPVDLTYNDIPKRYIYPVAEKNLNTNNYQAASASIGGDKLTTRLFWDKF
ncbi:SusD-like starch-binding protein associating with outer membrane [Chitinophaga niastensis]|uniref:SusD-like starch-binding protein associating with outer membrane n=1 Tax=Chitinophaga niastensis TaxID=536980 RepID=A0A2P8H9Z9_CHINA|nr:SusD/RagB family nutrient-binding outer membrane lipoprotein [Chitinophaga niastensis]PSL43045.1 SusD-like starch-binding protein associating with outer membrane [Chitinophaga niastensis]